MTFSILAYNEATGEHGVAIQSKFPGASTLCIGGSSGLGCFTTQAFANPEFHTQIPSMLEQGLSANNIIKKLLEVDDNGPQRQIAIFSAQSATFHSYTGSAIFDWAGAAGSKAGMQCLAIGNSLHSENVLSAMCESYSKQKDCHIAKALVEALSAGQKAGGEIRGMQSAGVLTFAKAGGYQGKGGKTVEIHVYDSKDPIAELQRCLSIHALSYFPSNEEDLVPIDSELATKLRRMLYELKYISSPEAVGWDEASIAAMARFMGMENYDSRIRNDSRIDVKVLNDIRQRYLPLFSSET